MPIEPFLTFLGAVVGSVLTFFGVRFAARQSAKAAEKAARVNERQVDVEEWRSIVSALRDEVNRLAGRVEALEQKRDRMEEELQAADSRNRSLLRYLREVLLWARRFSPDHVPPSPPADLADDL